MDITDVKKNRTRTDRFKAAIMTRYRFRRSRRIENYIGSGERQINRRRKRRYGIGTYRQCYGRFKVEELK